ncbi:MAG: response regulator [Bacteroidales bacterium]|nr:response regulator [Bacteroidales bacterium]
MRNRVLVFFILVAFVIAGLVFPINYFHAKKRHQIEQRVEDINEVYFCFVRDLKYTSAFISLETMNLDFFVKGESPYLKAHDLIQDSITHRIDSQLGESGSGSSSGVLYDISKGYKEFCQLFDSIVLYTYKRGYRYLGVEGEMLSYMYAIEKNYSELEGIPKIRSFEREYLNRNDQDAVREIRELSEDLVASLAANQQYPADEKLEIQYLLRAYTKSLTELSELDNRLGIRSNTGLKKDLFSQGNKLEKNLANYVASNRNLEKKQLVQLNILFGILALLLFLSVIGLSIYISKFLVYHLEKLSFYVSKLARHDFNYSGDKLNLHRSSREIRSIYREIRNMVAQLRIREKQRDAAIAEARQSEKRYRDLSELLPQSIFETDKLGNLIYVNKAWYLAFGYTKEDLKEGLNLIEILQTNTDSNIFGINRIENSDYIAIRKDGTRFPAQVYADMIQVDMQMTGRRGIIIDATLRNKYIEGLKKETARAVSSDKQKSSFLANMSHEIRTPMNSIIGFANLLSTEGIEDEQKGEFVQHIQESGQLLLNLIDDIIDVAKIEAGEIKIKPGACDPAKIIHELIHSFEGYKTTLGKGDIELKAIVPNAEIMFNSDPFRLKQILSNLISNAIKFTDKGSVSISCTLKNDRLVEFAVEDTGIGMTKEDLNVIFSRFTRTSKAEAKNIAGTGLGLNISKNLVELLGGQMWVSSVPAEGSRFCFHLPFKALPVETKIPHATRKGESDTIFNWKGRTILIAEDDENSYVFLKEVLQKTQARIVHAVNGKEVVEAVKFSDEIDIILMDINMPYIDGYTATELIKKTRPSLPVIAQTAYAMEGDREKSILAGCDDYMTKPVNPQNLLAKINQFMPLRFKDQAPATNKPDHQETLASYKKKND